MPFADVRWLPTRDSIDRSLEDKPLGERKKIVITTTIVVDKKGDKEEEKEREKEKIEDKKKVRMQSTNRILLSRRNFLSIPKITLSFIETTFIITYILIYQNYQVIKFYTTMEFLYLIFSVVTEAIISSSFNFLLQKNILFIYYQKKKLLLAKKHLFRNKEITKYNLKNETKF